jgi:hypothetical protein
MQLLSLLRPLERSTSEDDPVAKAITAIHGDHERNGAETTQVPRYWSSFTSDATRTERKVSSSRKTGRKDATRCGGRLRSCRSDTEHKWASRFGQLE